MKATILLSGAILLGAALPGHAAPPGQYGRQGAPQTLTPAQVQQMNHLRALVAQHNALIRQQQAAALSRQAPQPSGQRQLSAADQAALAGAIANNNATSARIAGSWTAPACASSYRGC